MIFTQEKTRCKRAKTVDGSSECRINRRRIPQKLQGGDDGQIRDRPTAETEKDFSFPIREK